MKPIVAFLASLGWAASALAITIPTVQIGNPGNAADTISVDSDHPNGVGSVADSFNIGKTEVTNAQYVAFLNAVAASDPYELYSTMMAADTRGGIIRNGSSGSYSYALKAPAQNGTYIYDNKPVTFVSWADAVRFANWLNNGQPTGPESANTTEDGAYTLNGATTNATLNAVNRNAGANWWLPSEDEWYKAAYHKNDSVTANYWAYATGTNSRPNNNLPANDTGNSANFRSGEFTTGDGSFPLTDVGAYSLSGGPYGTFDQNGSVKEWDDTRLGESFRGLRGGGWNFPDNLRSTDVIAALPAFEGHFIGFRVATLAVPEPSTGLSCIAAIVLLSVRRVGPISSVSFRHRRVVEASSSSRE